MDDERFLRSKYNKSLLARIHEMFDLVIGYRVFFIGTGYLQSSPRKTLSQHKARIVGVYNNLESRLGYSLFLGGARHFAFYPKGKYFPWPLDKGLRAMEEFMCKELDLAPDSEVLDAGCGDGLVAIYMARSGGLKVTGVDITATHLRNAARRVKKHGLEDRIACHQLDFHDLSRFENETFDGVYAMETFCHALDPAKVLKEFYRVLKPGGSLVIHDFSYDPLQTLPSEFPRLGIAFIKNTYGAPSFREHDWLAQRLTESGFSNIVSQDLTANIAPLVRLFYVAAFLPFYVLVGIFGLKYRLINCCCAVFMYAGKDYWRYIALSAKKPGAAPKSSEAVVAH